MKKIKKIVCCVLTAVLCACSSTYNVVSDKEHGSSWVVPNGETDGSFSNGMILRYDKNNPEVLAYIYIIMTYDTDCLSYLTGSDEWSDQNEWSTARYHAGLEIGDQEEDTCLFERSRESEKIELDFSGQWDYEGHTALLEYMGLNQFYDEKAHCIRASVEDFKNSTDFPYSYILVNGEETSYENVWGKEPSAS